MREPRRGRTGSCVNSGGRGQDADDAVVNTSTTGGDIWTGGDDFNFDYAELSGDFDVSVEIFNYTHSTGAGRWGKLGLMTKATGAFRKAGGGPGGFSMVRVLSSTTLVGR